MVAQYRVRELEIDNGGRAKFTPDTAAFKRNLRALRIAKGYSISEFAERTGVSRKKLEDIEALRGYGCYVSWDYACTAANVLDVPLDAFLHAQ